MKYTKLTALHILTLLVSSISLPAQTPQSEQALKASQYYYRGAVAQSSDELDEALQLFRYAYALDNTDATIAHALGKLYAQKGQQSKAEPLLRQAYEADRTNRSFMKAYAQSLYSEEDSEGALVAIPVLEDWLKHDPEDEEVLYALGTYYLRGQFIDRALEIFDQLRQRNLNDYSRYTGYSLARARILELTYRHDEAVDELNKLVATFPAEYTVCMRAAKFLIENNAPQEAKPFLDRLSHGQTISDTELRNLYMAYYRALGERSEWERLLKEELEEPSVDAKTKADNWMDFLQVEAEDGKFPAAYNWVFDRIVKLHPEATATQLLYARILSSQGQDDKAIPLLMQLRQREPENSEVWLLLLNALISPEHATELIQYSQEGIQHHPKEWRIYYLGSIGYYLGDRKKEGTKWLEQAVGQLEEAKVDAYGLSLLYAQLGSFYEEAGKRQRVYQVYDKALTYNEGNVEVLNNYAYFLAEEGKDLERAERMALRGLKEDKDNENLLDTYAWILYLRGNYTLANFYMRKAIEAVGDDIQGVYYDHYGHILKAEGRKTEAIAQWQQAIAHYQKEISAETDRKKKRQMSASLRRLEQALRELQESANK